MSFRTSCNAVWFLFFTALVCHTACLGGPEFGLADKGKSNADAPPPDTEERSDGGPEASTLADSREQPIRRFSINRIETAAEAEESRPEFASGILLYTCDNEPPVVNLPRNHNTRRCEETAVATAFEDADGDAYDVAVPFVWQSAEPWVVAEAAPGNKNHPLAYFDGSRDIFDGDGETEPEAVVAVCAVNDCPAEALACVPEVCRGFRAVGIVNLESHWLVADTTFAEAGEELVFTQDGRNLRIENIEGHPFTHGVIAAATVSWEDGDILYVGRIAPDRNSFVGPVYEQINGTVIGSFEAKRLPGQEH